MQFLFMSITDITIELILGDITTLKVDAIVNAANSTLLGGGGVDGAIHRAAGPSLLEECRTLNGCETGEAKITGAYNLPANHIIHTVGPVWRGGKNHEDELLASCYSGSLKLADGYGLKSIAFPSISTGVYGFPFKRACKIALESIRKFSITNTSINRIVLVTFSKSDHDIYEEIYAEYFTIYANILHNT